MKLLIKTFDNHYLRSISCSVVLLPNALITYVVSVLSLESANDNVSKFLGKEIRIFPFTKRFKKTDRNSML